MKKTFVCFVAGALMLGSYIGSFSLTNKVLAWNRTLSDKFINEVVFLVITPAYSITSIIDLFVLNSVEFWTGKNPVAKVGHVENVWGKDGKMYAVKTMKDGYEITKPTGEKISFVYDKKENSWSMQQDGQTREIFRFNADGTVQANLQNGEQMNVSLNEEGIYQLRMAANGGTFFAQR
jgi:hypothetical protein